MKGFGGVVVVVAAILNQGQCSTSISIERKQVTTNTKCQSTTGPWRSLADHLGESECLGGMFFPKGPEEDTKIIRFAKLLRKYLGKIRDVWTETQDLYILPVMYGGI